jgi:hypothetical protein
MIPRDSGETETQDGSEAGVPREATDTPTEGTPDAPPPDVAARIRARFEPMVEAFVLARRARRLRWFAVAGVLLALVVEALTH